MVSVLRRFKKSVAGEDPTAECPWMSKDAEEDPPHFRNGELSILAVGIDAH